MTGSRLPWTLLLGVVGAAALGLAAFVAPRSAAQGWLAAFVFWSGISVGALVLLLTHRLTGGRWGETLAPALLPLAGLMPLAALAYLPLAAGTVAIFPWAADPGSLPPGVASIYLNGPAFLIRSGVALAGWSLLSVLVVQGRCTILVAALGLAFHGLIVGVVAVDWILSLEPPFTSSAFGAGIAIQQILSALAVAALLAPERSAPAARDLAGLTITALLGVVYLDFMSYVVAWYGNLPDKAAWYLRREEAGWAWPLGAAFLVGAVIPFAGLLSGRVRASRGALRAVGALILIGVWLHVLWLVAPAFGSGALAAAFGALLVMVAVSMALLSAVPILRSWRPLHVG
jgi:hypothetical protein